MMLVDVIKETVREKQQIPFSEFMQMALYHPTLGYYCKPSSPIGPEGDFVTAPELTPLFAYSVANQIAQVARALNSSYDILELGAGLGRLACDSLIALKQKNLLPRRYYILEISPHLRKAQQMLIQDRAPELLSHIQWLDSLDEICQPFQGIILGNEFLDALPVELFKINHAQKTEQAFVTLESNELKLVYAPTNHSLFTDVLSKELHQLPCPLTPGYQSEICLALHNWIAQLSQVLCKGVILFLDYGFGRSEYFHPQRHMGTLMCHHKHTVHSAFFHAIGNQDITAHVNFSQCCEAAYEAQLNLLGFTTQANFLLALGILDHAQTSEVTPKNVSGSQALQVLLQPHEMGELIKVIAFGKNFDSALQGFSLRDTRHQL